MIIFVALDISLVALDNQFGRMGLIIRLAGGIISLVMLDLKYIMQDDKFSHVCSSQEWSPHA